MRVHQEEHPQMNFYCHCSYKSQTSCVLPLTNITKQSVFRLLHKFKFIILCLNLFCIFTVVLILVTAISVNLFVAIYHARRLPVFRLLNKMLHHKFYTPNLCLDEYIPTLWLHNFGTETINIGWNKYMITDTQSLVYCLIPLVWHLFNQTNNILWCLFNTAQPWMASVV